MATAQVGMLFNVSGRSVAEKKIHANGPSWDSQLWSILQSQVEAKLKSMSDITTIGIVADTHGLVRPELLDLFKGVSLIFHAGDIGIQGVLDQLREIAPVIAVRGNVDKEPWATSLPVFEISEVTGRLIYLIHDIQMLDFDPKAAGIHVVISGHSHVPKIFKNDGILYVNPGSAGPRRFKLVITAVLLRIDRKSGEIMADIKRLL